MKRDVIIIISTWLLCSSCAHKVTEFYPEIIPKQMNTSLSVGKGQHKVNLTYFGCGNMIIEQDGDAILTDPFFSNQKVLKMWGKIQTKTDLYELWKGRVQSQASRGMVKAGLVSHTHYDHVMDLPTLLQDHYFSKMEVVYGNSYLPRMMTNFMKEGVRIETLKVGEWVNVTPGIRFLPIESNHAPHTKHKLYMSGPLDANYFKENLVWPNAKIRTRKWSVGTVHAFLVDFIQGDTLRMYISTSASSYPVGRPPQEELKRKKVDIAVLPYALATNVKDYPKAIISDINPSKLVIVHWEDFFREPKSDDDVKLVRQSNPKKIRKLFDQLGKKKDFFVMPKPGTKIQITK